MNWQADKHLPWLQAVLLRETGEDGQICWARAVAYTVDLCIYLVHLITVYYVPYVKVVRDRIPIPSVTACVHRIDVMRAKKSRCLPLGDNANIMTKVESRGPTRQTNLCRIGMAELCQQS